MQCGEGADEFNCEGCGCRYVGSMGNNGGGGKEKNPHNHTTNTTNITNTTTKHTVGWNTPNQSWAKTEHPQLFFHSGSH